LDEDAGAVEAADVLREGESFVVLGDHGSSWGEERRGGEELEDARIVLFGGVGRIEEDEVVEGGLAARNGEFFEAADSVEGKNFCGGEGVEGFEIAADEGSGGSMIFDEDGFDGTTAEGFNADGAGTGEQVDETGVGNSRAEDVEQSFAEAVAGGAQGLALERFENAAAVGAGDDAHWRGLDYAIFARL
jgi:hypothetical protein